MTKEKPIKITPIDWIDRSDRYLVVPGTVLEKYRLRIKEILYAKKNCLFATGVPKSIIDFIYRCVKQLNLDDRTLIFSRGMVRTKKDRKKYAVSVKELAWDVGTLITIPRLLKYREMITLKINSAEHSFRLMELVVLRGLLQIALPGRNASYYPAMAAAILAWGWKALEMEGVPDVYRL